MNQIIGTGTAIINNQQTALAGCTNEDCTLDCMRKDERMIYQRVDLYAEQNESLCRFFIPFD